MSKLSRENQRVLDKQLKGVEEYPAEEIRYVLETYGAGLSAVQVDRLACLAGCMWYYGKVAGRAEALEVKDAFRSCATVTEEVRVGITGDARIPGGPEATESWNARVPGDTRISGNSRIPGGASETGERMRIVERKQGLSVGPRIFDVVINNQRHTIVVTESIRLISPADHKLTPEDKADLMENLSALCLGGE